MDILGENWGESETKEATVGMRFIERDGKKILQQCWRTMKTDRNGHVIDGGYDWRDVPLVQE
jgi:hypothetical protein